MNFIVRLYWQHDVDLIALAVNPGFQIGHWIKRAVSAYVRREELIIPIPSESTEPVKLDNYCTHFVLDDNKDKDVIAFINMCRPGLKNSMIKTIFRAYLEKPFLVSYISENYITKSRRSNRYSIQSETHCTKNDFETGDVPDNVRSTIVGNIKKNADFDCQIDITVKANIGMSIYKTNK